MSMYHVIHLGIKDQFLKLALQMQNFLILSIIKILVHGPKMKHLLFLHAHIQVHAHSHTSTHMQAPPTCQSNKHDVVFM